MYHYTIIATSSITLLVVMLSIFNAWNDSGDIHELPYMKIFSRGRKKIYTGVTSMKNMNLNVEYTSSMHKISDYFGGNGVVVFEILMLRKTFYFYN